MKRTKKNYLAGLLVTILLWVLLALVIWFVDPNIIADWLIPDGYLVFFGLLFLAVFFSMSYVLGNVRRGLLVAFGVLILGYLKIWRISSWFNTVLLIGILIAIEVYSWGKTEDDTI